MCYRVYSSRRTWLQAENICIGNNGHLISLDRYAVYYKISGIVQSLGMLLPCLPYNFTPYNPGELLSTMGANVFLFVFFFLQKVVSSLEAILGKF